LHFTVPFCLTDPQPEGVSLHPRVPRLCGTQPDFGGETERFPSQLRGKAYKLVRVAAPDGQTPIDYRMTFIGHQKEAKECLEQMLAWQPEKIILAHGSCFLENGRAELRRALRWIR